MSLIDITSPTWPFDLGQLFLTAATSCGFDCTRAFVADGGAVDGLPPGCDCQLAVLLDVGWRRERGVAPGCSPLVEAKVMLVLDLCVLDPGDDIATPEQINESAAESLRRRLLVLQGLQRARFNGNLGFACTEVELDDWHLVSHVGGMARWQTTWIVRP